MIIGGEFISINRMRGISNMSEIHKNKKNDNKKGKENNNIKDLLEYIWESVISDIILNLVLFIPRMIGKLLKAIFS